ncbi:uncharacterized protein LOC114359107 isoform X1 [Ostrinia furnacalis]|uniref:uncharacterized protein LOC114359107 isoform X1 n=2 Tax=Ostrinia furnacalis TaxID=93504 RepID=UPI00103C86D6|nr:uncharacterized protein LOC114359107 isoform X1 [Ostrinia furnacalis]
MVSDDQAEGGSELHPESSVMIKSIFELYYVKTDRARTTRERRKAARSSRGPLLARASTSGQTPARVSTSRQTPARHSARNAPDESRLSVLKIEEMRAQAHLEMARGFSSIAESFKLIAESMARMSQQKKMSTAECRACLLQVQTGELHNLFHAWNSSWAGMKSTIAEDLSLLTEVQFTETDKHSKVICTSCCENLMKACKFKLLVQENDKMLRQRCPETENQSTDKVWPQPIQVDKSITGVYSEPLQVEIKQEVLTDDENMTNGDEGYSNVDCLDMIKIEPEEIAAPVTNAPSSFRVTDMNGQECLEEEDEPSVDKTDRPVQDKVSSADASKKTDGVTKAAAPLTHADVMVAVAEALSKPVEVRKEAQRVTPEVYPYEVDLTVSPNSPAPNDTHSDNAIRNTANNPGPIVGTESNASSVTHVQESTQNIDGQNNTEKQTSVDRTSGDISNDAACEKRNETILIELEPVLTCSDSDVEVIPSTVTSHSGRITETNTNDSSVPTRSKVNTEVPLLTDQRGVETLIQRVIDENVKELKSHLKDEESQLLSPKSEPSDANDNFEFEMISSNKEPSFEKLKAKAVPKLTSESQKIFAENTNYGLSQKLDSLSETVATVIENQKSLADTQEKILAHVMGMSSQFEQFMKQSQMQTSHLKTSTRLDPFINRRTSNIIPLQPMQVFEQFKPISNQEEMAAFEDSLKDEAFGAELRSKLLPLCASGKGKAISNAYVYLDVLFERKFLTRCSWSGGSRDDNTKLCFKFYKRTIIFFFSLVYTTDQTFTFAECEEFIKRVLRNSNKREAAKMMRASTSRRRGKRRKKVEECDSDDISQEIDETQFLNTLITASGYEETVREDVT